MTRVLIAVDESNESVEAARVAHRLFGDEAEYLVVNVADPLSNTMAWGYVYPIVPPIAAYPMMLPGGDAALGGTGEDDETPVEHAEQRAADVVAQAHLEHAEAVGEVGDAASAIIGAADRHGADVIVVGSHERSWFDKLMKASVTKRVLSDATIPVLIVK